MEINKKYALLDTDFLYKVHLARNDENYTLAEIVLSFTEYDFFCHEMIKEELSRHNIVPDPNPWLADKIRLGRIKMYTDADILCELSKVYGEAATLTYLSLLQESCNTFDVGFYERYYGDLENIENVLDKNVFLAVLKECDDRIPHQNGVGEKKSLVLVQMMEILYSDQVYVFCSDDFKARQSIAGLSKPINCISILGIFHKLKELGYGKSEMQIYYDRLSAFLKTQMEYKVWSMSGHQRIKIAISQVYDDIYEGKFELLRNGDLHYIK